MTLQKKPPINTEKFSAALRRRGIDLISKKVLVTNFEGSKQAQDLKLPPNCEGWGRVHHFRRLQGDGWLPNPLPMDPAMHALGLPLADSVEVQVFQNAICNWRCWYCFVDFELLSASPDHSGFKSADELIDLYLAENRRPQVIDLSGGQPDLVPEWTLWFMDSLTRRGVNKNVYVWSDDNLSNDYLWRFLTNDELTRLACSRNYGRVGCFKGFDEESFSFNTLAEPQLFSLQFNLMKRLVKAGFDVYGYVTLTSVQAKNLPHRMANFIDRLQSEVNPLFPLRTVPLKILEFTPTKDRVTEEHERAVEIQHEALEAWKDELESRFTLELRSKPIFEVQLLP